MPATRGKQDPFALAYRDDLENQGKPLKGTGMQAGFASPWDTAKCSRRACLFLQQIIIEEPYDG